MALRSFASLLKQLPWPARLAALQRIVETPSARRARLAQAMSTPAERLVIVCHGNIMRSAFAVAHMQQQAPHLASRLVGAGTHATAGRLAQDSALRIAREFGVPLDTHRAQPLDLVTLGATDVIVCMDRANEANVMACYPAQASRVFLIGDVATDDSNERAVIDPYARGDDATRAAFQQIIQHSRTWRSVLDGGQVTAR